MRFLEVLSWLVILWMTSFTSDTPVAWTYQTDQYDETSQARFQGTWALLTSSLRFVMYFCEVSDAAHIYACAEHA